jgi:hypothetical protein
VVCYFLQEAGFAQQLTALLCTVPTWHDLDAVCGQAEHLGGWAAVQQLFELHVGLTQAVATETDGCFGMCGQHRRQCSIILLSSEAPYRQSILCRAWLQHPCMYIQLNECSARDDMPAYVGDEA